MRIKCAYWACDRMIETKGTTRKYCSERCKELAKRERVNFIRLEICKNAEVKEVNER